MQERIKAKWNVLALMIAVFLGVAQVTRADPLEDGFSAAGRGDYATALRLWRPLANQGVAQAQFNLGSMYQNGDGVAQSYVEAVKWYRLAADQGHAVAQNNLGLMYRDGQGVTNDYAEAAKWFRIAADKENREAQINLGLMYRDGQGVTKDYVEAVKWFRLGVVDGPWRIWNCRDAGGVTRLSDLASDVVRLLSDGGTCRTVRQERTIQTANVTPSASAPDRAGSKGFSLIPLQKDGGTFVVPVLINNIITLNFVVDSGATDVSIPEDVVRTLIRTGTLKRSDFLGKKTYVLADGSKVPSQTFRIRSMRVGDRVVENVTGSMTTVEGSLLLGQSFLGRFKSWSIDNGKHALRLE